MPRYIYGKKLKDCNGHIWDEPLQDDNTEHQVCKRCGNYRYLSREYRKNVNH